MSSPVTDLATDTQGARKQITAVFLDVVGFSDMAGPVDPEDLQDWLDSFYAQSGEIIAAHGGEVTEYLGDGIVALFGLIRADELAASKAVNAAMTAMSMIRTKDRKGISLQLRIGIATGEAAVRARTAGNLPRATGLVTTLAQRIQEKAKPGQVLVAQSTYALLRGTITADVIPNVILKGFPTPQTLYRPVGIQQPKHDTAQPHLFGREDVCAQITKSTLPVLVMGQAGIGKSAIAHFVAQLAPSVTTIAGDGVQMRASYQPFIRWITQQTGQRLPTMYDLRATFPTLDGTTISALAMTLGLPEGKRLLAELSNVALRPLIEESIAAAINALYPKGLIIFEDLHWFDNASMDALAHLLSNGKSNQHRVLMTSRENTQTGLHLDAIPMTTITVPVLDAMSAGNMISALTPATTTRAAKTALLEKAAGIPLFLEQLAKWTAAETDRGEVPSSLMDLLSDQIDGTGPAKAVLQCAAVIGQKFDLDLLAAIAPSDAPVLGRLLIAEAKGVVQQLDATQWVFRHALLQQAAYQGILRRERVQYHAQLATHLQTHHADAVRRAPALLTDHLILSEQYVAAIENYLSVSQWALFQGALLDADAHVVDAIALCQEVPADVDARALEISCQATRGAILMQTHGFTADPVRRVYQRISELAARQNGYAAENGPAFYGSFTHALAMGDKSRAEWIAQRLRNTADNLAPGADNYDLQQAALNVDVAYQFYSGAFEKASQSFARMRGLYDRDRRQSMIGKYGIDGFASAQMFEAVARAVCGDSHLVPALSAETDAHQDLLNIPIMRPYALVWGGVALYYGGERAAALARIAKGIDLAQASGSAYWELAGAVWTFVFDPSKSATAKGLAAFEQTIQAHEMIGANLTLPFYRAHYALAVLNHGRHEEAHLVAQQARREAEQSGFHCWYAEILRISATTCVAIGRDDAARQALSDAALIAEKQRAKLWLLRTRLDQHRLGFIGDEVLGNVIATFDPAAHLPEREDALAALGAP